jgi:hypothetical protein
LRPPSLKALLLAQLLSGDDVDRVAIRLVTQGGKQRGGKQLSAPLEGFFSFLFLSSRFTTVILMDYYWKDLVKVSINRLQLVLHPFD